MSRLSKSLSPASLSLKNFSLKLYRSVLASSESLILEGRSVESVAGFPNIREAEAKDVLGGPRTMFSKTNKHNASVQILSQ